MNTLSPKENDGEKDLRQLQQQELSGTSDDDLESLALSDTDEDENEGLGDGNLGGNRIDEEE